MEQKQDSAFGIKAPVALLLICLLNTSVLAVGGDNNKNDERPVPSIKNSNYGIMIFQNENSDDYLNIGGALRYNLYLTDYGGQLTEDDTQFTLDTWRININGQTSGININFEYRFYPTFGTHFIKQGWLGYNFTEQTNFQVGVTQVPFGLLQYASHNWWFQLPYYMGLEDDHDMGFKLTTSGGNWDFALAYFMQADPNGGTDFAPANTGRYSYDIVSTADQGQSNRETNQFNVRTVYNWDHGSAGTTEIGGSAQYGGIYNSVLDETGDHYALAGHLDGTYGNFNVKAEYIYFEHNARTDAGANADVVKMAAYGVEAYDVAAEGTMYVAGISYSHDVEWGPVSNLTFYENYTYMDKANKAFNNSQHNVLGFMVTAGNMYTYFDIASGKNQPWLTDDFGQGLGAGNDDPRWNTRFNINIGYYF